MPTYMDIHEAPGATWEALATAHAADVETQGKYGVKYLKYWFNENRGNVFCLCTAPNQEAAITVHREAHGLLASKIIEVAPEVAESFLGGCEADASGAARKGREYDSGVRTVLFTDMENSTSLTQHLGDEAAMVALSIHDRIVRSALRSLGGTEVKHTGDGIMASFPSSVCAVKCAMLIHRQLAAQGQSDLCVRVRIGVAAGEPVESHDDLFGTTVQLAARLCARARPEQSLVSNAVAELCLGKGLRFRDLGKMRLKGFEAPVRVHAVEVEAPVTSGP